MALGLDVYGSDSDTDNEDESKVVPQQTVAAKKRPKRKIAITLDPAPEPDDSQPPPPKKLRADTGATSSALFSVLPAPKLTQASKPPELSKKAPLNFSISPPLEPPTEPAPVPTPASSSKPIDFFALDTPSVPGPSASIPVASSSKASISAAPDVPHFQPPDPSPTDEYPGYYQLPSGKWAAHDPQVYNRFLQQWHADYNQQVRALEKSQFQEQQAEGADEVDAMQESEKMRKLYAQREERKKLTQKSDVPAAPKMTVNASKMSGIARSRHQLSTMLMQAYQNREALEEKIAEGRRNRKEAGAKYGF